MENNELNQLEPQEIPAEEPQAAPVAETTEAPVGESQEIPVQEAPAAPANAVEKVLGVVKGFVGEVVDFLKQTFTGNVKENLQNSFKNEPKKSAVLLGVPAAAAILAIILVVVIICSIVSGITNNYTSPINSLQKAANENDVEDMLETYIGSLNGFCEDEINDLWKILKSADMYDDAKESLQDYLDEAIEDAKSEYGDNYRIKYKIEEKEKLDKDDLEDVEDGLDDLYEQIKELCDQCDDFDSDDWDDLADEIGVSRSRAKKMVSLAESVGKQLKRAKVSAGYELEITISITGSELDEPEEEEVTYTVYKVNGSWICLDGLMQDIFSLYGAAMYGY